MIKTEIVNFETAPNPLCRTYSDENRCLIKIENGVKYGSSVVDLISGYDVNGDPVSRFHYTESNEFDDTNVEQEDDDEYAYTVRR